MYSSKGHKSNNSIKRNRKSSETSNKNYPFSRNVNRLQYIDQIDDLFDEKPVKNSKGYYGRISGIEAMIDFRFTSPCRINAKTEEDLIKLYTRVLNSLSWTKISPQ